MRKIGKAKIDLEADLWTAEDSGGHFHMNRRLVEIRPEVKKFMAQYRKATRLKRPTQRQPQKREEYFKTRDESRRQLRLFWAKVYKEILEESFTYPVALRLNRDFDHNSDWRYCLYKGQIYQFDKPNLSDDEMIRQIDRWEGVNAI